MNFSAKAFGIWGQEVLKKLKRTMEDTESTEKSPG